MPTTFCRRSTRRCACPAPTGESGRLLLAASYTVIGYFLPYHLQRLSQLYPNLDIQLHELNRNAIEEGLIAHRYDMAVLLTSNVVNPELAVEHFFGSPRRLWVPARHPLLARDTVTLEDVAHEPFIMLTVDEAAHRAALLERNAIPPRRAPAHLVGGGGAQHGGQWRRRGGAVGHGLSPVVAGRAPHRDHPVEGSDPADERGVGVAQGRGHHGSDARGARLFPPRLCGAAWHRYLALSPIDA